MISIDFLSKDGVITFNDLHLDESKPLTEQIDELKEDMLQVEFPYSYLLDAGWFPSFNENGKFHIVLVKDYDWQKPVYSGTANNVVNLKKEIILAISKIPAN